MALNTTMDNLPVASARKIVLDARYDKDGISCPCCMKFTKVYRRSITLTQVKVLAKLYNVARKREPHAPTTVWVKIGTPEKGREKEALFTKGGDYGKARWWNLIEGRDGEREDGSSRVGYWRITELGIEFLLGTVRVSKYVWEYDNVPVPPPPGAANPKIDVYSVANKFDYMSIMNAE